MDMDKVHITVSPVKCRKRKRESCWDIGSHHHIPLEVTLPTIYRIDWSRPAYQRLDIPSFCLPPSQVTSYLSPQTPWRVWGTEITSQVVTCPYLSWVSPTSIANFFFAADKLLRAFSNLLSVTFWSVRRIFTKSFPQVWLLPQFVKCGAFKSALDFIVAGNREIL